MINITPNLNFSLVLRYITLLMIRNFLFHRVNPLRDKLWDPMDVTLFEKCIQYISSKYEVLVFEELVKSEKINSKNKIATIMFDDGYKDNIEYALPILEKYNCKASFYVVTECIDKNIPTWTHILEYLFQHTAIKKIDLTTNILPKQLQVSSLDTYNDRIQYVSLLKPYLKKMDHLQREQILNIIIQTYSDVELPKIMMDWDDLKLLKSKGHYIGSHTLSHPALGTIENEEILKKELAQSGSRIQEMLGYFPKTISYPVGSYSEKTKQLSKVCGYEIGLAVKQQIYSPQKSNIFEVDRIELYNESWLKTRLRISNKLEEFKKLIRYK